MVLMVLYNIVAGQWVVLIVLYTIVARPMDGANGPIQHCGRANGWF